MIIFLDGQIFNHVTTLLYLLIANQGACIFVWFLHFFSCLPKFTQENAHASTCNKNFNCTNYCLCDSLCSFDRDCFSDFCTYMLDQKDYNPCLMFTVLYYLSSQLDSNPGYCGEPAKLSKATLLSIGILPYFVYIFISNVNSLKYIGHVSTLFCLGYEVTNTFFIHPNYSSTREEFKVLISLISDKYDSDTTNGMVMNCLSESVECSHLAIK